ncbi:MAG: T9SS type A sorting domain-containing protein [Bacteroidetes bacterium]|nr:T9SS type A sorting domain-containing protein [Bacteroidota bacterium]MBU1578610.1 T9SS type A sorting domain-containing protein [Bacteroidota bacterium]MBU2558336.1 T9SS type A sorting domain-containing protein [Bacteroidota bacterium]
MSTGRKTKLRRILLLLLIFILTGLSNGFTQEWMPIKPGEKYNYLYNSGIIHTTVWVDSVDYNNGDSVYYLNRIGLAVHQYLIKSHVFLQKEIHFNDQKLVLFSPEEYVIPLEMSLGDSWIFDTINNLTATLASVFEDNVFGQNDSIREIIIEDGQANQHTMRISKNHGVLRFPDFAFPDSAYILAGLENAGLGQQMPLTREFFDIHVGDEYEYREVHEYATQFNADQYVTRKRYKVISINDTSDQFQYVVRGVYKLDYYGAYGGHSVRYGIINETHTASKLTNLYPNQLYRAGEGYKYCKYAWDEEYQAPSKSEGSTQYMGVGDTMRFIHGGPEITSKYILGIGLVKSNIDYLFNEYWHTDLLAYQKDGIVHGNFADYCYLLDPEIKQEMRIITSDTTINTLDTLIIRANPGFDSYEWINTGTVGEQDTIIASEYGTGSFRFGLDITYMHCIQSDTFQLNIIEAPDSIPEPDTITSIVMRLLPSGELHIENASTEQLSMRLEIINQAGQPVYVQEHILLIDGGKAMISLTSLPHGFYVARIVTDESVFTKKISR